MAQQAKYQGWMAAGIFNGLQKLSVPVFGIVTTMILAKHTLTKQEMGVWALFLIITSFVELIRQGLVKTSMIKFMNHSEATEHKLILSAALFLNATITLLLIFIMFITGHYFSVLLHAPELESMLYIYFIGMLLLIPFSHFEWIMYTKSQFKSLFWLFFIRQGSTVIMLVIFMFVNYKISLSLLVLIYSGGILLGTIAGYKYVKHHLTHTFELSMHWVKEMWHFGKYVFGTGISTIVFSNASQMMLSPILGSTAFTASQNIASRVINLTDMPSQVLSDLIFPHTAKKENAENKERVKYYYEKTVGATLCFNIPMVAFIILFPKFIILVLADKQYLDAVPYLQLASLTGLFLAFLKQWGVIIDSIGRPRLNFIMISVLAVVHVILAYVCITYYGFMGCAYALLLTHLIGFVATQYVLNRIYNISFINCFKQAFLFYPEISKLLIDKFFVKWKTR